MHYQVAIEFSFEAAHRLLYHPGKCRYLHGHGYKAVLVVEKQKPMLPKSTGMVIDFAELKSTVGAWIDNNWDHNILLQTNDPLYDLYFDQGEAHVLQKQVVLSNDIFRGKKPYTFPEPPTAEILAEELMHVAPILLEKKDPGLYVVSVTIHETNRCSATARDK